MTDQEFYQLVQTNNNLAAILSGQPPGSFMTAMYYQNFKVQALAYLLGVDHKALEERVYNMLVADPVVKEKLNALISAAVAPPPPPETTPPVLAKEVISDFLDRMDEGYVDDLDGEEVIPHG